MFYYTCSNCILIYNEYRLYGWHVTLLELTQRSISTLRTPSNVLDLRINLIYQ